MRLLVFPKSGYVTYSTPFFWRRRILENLLRGIRSCSIYARRFLLFLHCIGLIKHTLIDGKRKKRFAGCRKILNGNSIG